MSTVNLIQGKMVECSMCGSIYDKEIYKVCFGCVNDDMNFPSHTDLDDIDAIEQLIEYYRTGYCSFDEFSADDYVPDDIIESEIRTQFEIDEADMSEVPFDINPLAYIPSCKFDVRSECRNGHSCRFSHDLKHPGRELCKFDQHCTNRTCRYRHTVEPQASTFKANFSSTVGVKLCRYYAQGYCSYGHACKNSHDPILRNAQ